MKINILLISTRRYHIFVQPLLEGIKKYFLVNHEIEVHLFTDNLEPEYIGDDRVKVTKELIPSYKFPTVTLYRYKIFCSKRYTGDYTYYLDVDMGIVDFVDESIFMDIVAVRHPGYDKVGGGSWETNELSTAYTYPENRISYYAGGFNGGKTEYFYRLMQRMKVDIEEDERNGIMPVWQDESVFNRHLSEMKYFKELDSRYCMVEQMSLREKWGLSELKPFIIALSKDHAQIRS